MSFLLNMILQQQQHLFNCPLSGLPRWAGTRKVKPICILLKQETVGGCGISWTIFKSAPCSRQATTPAPHHSVFYRLDALPATRPTASKYWKQWYSTKRNNCHTITLPYSSEFFCDFFSCHCIIHQTITYWTMFPCHEFRHRQDLCSTYADTCI